MQKNNQKPSDPAKEALDLVKEVKEEVLAYRKPLEKHWKKQENFYYGKQHKTGEDFKTTKNYIFTIVETSVPILTDSIHGTSIISDQDDRQDDAKVLEKSIKWVYEDQNIQLLLPSLVRTSLISSPGFLYTFYDPDAANGEGKIRDIKLTWENVALDGNASSIEDCTKARIEFPRRLGEIARLHPDKKDEILDIVDSKNVDSGDGSKEGFETRDNSGHISSPGRPKKYQAKDIANYVETWVKSYDLEPIPQEDTEEELAKEREQLANGESPDIFKWENHQAHKQDHLNSKAQLLAQIGLPPEATFEQASAQVDALMQQNPEADLSPILLAIKVCENHIEEHTDLERLNPTSERPKYKDGWRVIKTVKDIVLYDGPNPEQGDDPSQSFGIPLTLFYCYKDDTIYGFSETKNLIDIQESLNMMDYKEYRSLKRNSNSGWIADHESDVSDENLTDEEGIVVKKAKGTEVRRLDPGVTSPQLAERKASDKLALEYISGINEATQGITPSANASGAAITALQTQAIGRIRLKDRLLKYSMKRLGKIHAVLIINNWSTEKKLRLRTDTSGTEELIFNPIKMSDLGYSVEISDGTMAGIDKDALNSLYLNLLSQKVITPKQFFLAADIPKKELIMKSMEEDSEMQIQQVQEEAQMQLEQANQMIAQLQKENIKFKAAINPELLSNDEKKALEDFSRQEAIETIQGNAGAINGQPENQGI